MLGKIKKEDCCGCSACEQGCPRGCIEMVFDEEGFQYPRVNKAQCINCGICESVCPISSKEKKNKTTPEKIYIAYANNEVIRMSSSSGGIFTLLAEKCIEENGAVCGAAFSDSFDVCHMIVEKREDIEKLQGSKYVQSKIDNVYKEVKYRLEKDEEVIFSGTPCQVMGLKAYLRKEYKNLLTVDILCHGVPSAKLWKKYLAEQEKAHGSAVRSAFFRHKKYGWKNYSVLLEFDNNTVYERIFTEDSFMQMFLANISLRPSCYNCHFKEMPHSADITLGDCWGVELHSPEMDDNKGTSVILLNTDKGVQKFQQICANVICKASCLDEAIPSDSESRKSVREHPNRKAFFKNIDKRSIDELKKYLKISILTKVLNKSIRILLQVTKSKNGVS